MIKSILIDLREPDHIKNIKIDGVPTMTMTLDAGDILVACDDGSNLVIERKSPNDLLASIADNRLFNQTAKMRKLSDWCYVVITGKIDDSGYVDEMGRMWNYASIWGALLSVMEMGVFVIFCDGEDDFAPCIVRLAKRNRKIINVKPIKQVHVFGGQEATLASLPGIGTKKAVDYLKMFDGLGDTIMNLCAPPNKTFKIPGWGAKSAANLNKFFDW